MQALVGFTHASVIGGERFAGGHALCLGNGEGVFNLPYGDQQQLDLGVVQFYVVAAHTRSIKRPAGVSRSGVQFPMAVYSVCVPLTPPSLKVTGTALPAATVGTNTLN